LKILLKPPGSDRSARSLRASGQSAHPLFVERERQTGRTALVEYSNEGHYIATHWMPTKDESPKVTGTEFADGYCYDARVLPRKNVLLTTSFTG